MAFLEKSVVREQFAAILHMRWRVLVNSLRTTHGKFDLGAGLLQGVFFLMIWIGTGIGLGFAAWDFAAHGGLQQLSLLLWPVLVAWQVIPFVLASFQENVDLSFLLRFPVSFRFYTALYIFSGFFDLASLMGGVALLGMWIGITAARTDLAVWAALTLILFAAFNLLLARTIFAWVNRWLAQRKTREILAMLFLFSFLGLQFLNPAFHRRGGDGSSPHSFLGLSTKTIEHMQKPFPPALAADSLAKADGGPLWQGAVPLGGIALYTLGVAALLGFHLQAEWRGEKLSDGTKRQAKQSTLHRHTEERPSWFRISGALGAVVEKESLYIRRSGVLLYNLAAPPILVFLFGSLPRSHGGYTVEYALPLGVAYGFLGLTRLVGNSLGGETAGIQLYFLSPTPFRTIMLGKNLLQIGLFCIELTLVGAIVWLRFGMPGHVLIAATSCWLLFALPAQLALGNSLSIKMAYPMTLTRISREPGSLGNALMSLLIQSALAAVGVGIFFFLSRLGYAAWAAPAFLVLAICATIGWLHSLASVDRMVQERREVLIDTLVRA